MIVVLCCYWVLVTYFLSLVCLFTFTPGPGSVACCLEVTCGDILESCITRAGRILEFCFPMLRGRRGGDPDTVTSQAWLGTGTHTATPSPHLKPLISLATSQQPVQGAGGGIK